jgi:peptidyl-tRNA hydrolase, PTH1 family
MKRTKRLAFIGLPRGLLHVCKCAGGKTGADGAEIIKAMIKLFVGLGNPGPEYEATRHNAGFWFIDALERELKCSLAYDKSYFGLMASTVVAGRKLWLLKPSTFMNLSGKSVGALAKYFKIAPEEILVAHDELDVVPGQAKIKLGGSHAGHNGLRDIHAQLGTDQYWRLRIGIGHPGVKSEVIHWVLKKPMAEHRDGIAQTIERGVKALPHFVSGEMEKAMLVVHTAKPQRPKPPRSSPPAAPAVPAAPAAPAAASAAPPV